MNLIWHCVHKLLDLKGGRFQLVSCTRHPEENTSDHLGGFRGSSVKTTCQLLTDAHEVEAGRSLYSARAEPGNLHA